LNNENPNILVKNKEGVKHKRIPQQLFLTKFYPFKITTEILYTTNNTRNLTMVNLVKGNKLKPNFKLLFELEIYILLVLRRRL
jgi:hypothetical protein